MQVNKHKEDTFEAQNKVNLLVQLGQTDIRRLKLPKQIASALIIAGITTVADLASLSERELSLIKRVGMKSVAEIQKALNQALNSPADYIETTALEQEQPLNTWAEIIEPFLRSEQEIRIYVFLSRFGFHKKTLQELATELKVSGEWIRQIEKLAAKRLVKHTRSSKYITIVDRIIKIVSNGKEDLSLTSLKSILTEKGLLGEFSKPIRSQRSDVEPFEILIGWLDVISNSKIAVPPMKLPITIDDLRNAGSLSIKDTKALHQRPYSIISKLLSEVKYKSGIHLRDVMKILSAGEEVARLQLENLNLHEIRDGWFSPASLTVTGKKQPLIFAGKKMLSNVKEIDFPSFYEGLSRYAERYVDSLAPPEVASHYLQLAGFEFKENTVSYPVKVQGGLSQAELCLIDAIRANGNVATFNEIVEAFRKKGFSLSLVSNLLTHSPVPERVDIALYKIRGADVPWSDVVNARRRQKTSRKIDK